MEFTGERYMPDKFDEKDNISQMHLKRYEFALSFCENRQVIDIACGEGYGSNELSEKAKKIIGIDISEDAINYANTKYVKSNLFFKVGSVEHIEEVDESVDLIVSFETIEHVSYKKQIKFLSEVKRVLKPGGMFIISTPDKDICGEGHNEFHLCEMNKNGFVKILKPFFESIELYGQDAKIYKNRLSLFFIRLLHKLIKLDKYKIRHKIFPKKFRLGVDNGLANVSMTNVSHNDDNLFPVKIKDTETAMFLVAVCIKK